MSRRFAYFLDSLARVSHAARSAHTMYLRVLESRGVLLVGGAFRDGSGAMVCVTADDEADADAIARADPLVVFGFTLYQLREIERLPQLIAEHLEAPR